MLGSAYEFHQGFQHRHYRLADGLACPRHVIHFVLADVVIPFSRLIQQFLGIGQIERRGMLRVRRHRRGPGMFKLQSVLWLMEANSRGIALWGNALDAQVGGAPHFVQHHFGVWSLQNFLHRFPGNPQHMVLLVVSTDAVHLLEITDIARPDGFLSVHPQLTEVNRTSVEVGHIGHQQLPLTFPTGNLHTATDNGILSLDGQSAVLRSEPQGLIEIIGTCLKMDGHFGGLSQSSHFAGLAQGIGQRRVGSDTNVCCMGVHAAEERNETE